ncbi:MAG: hypothetical protein LPJ92_02130 [Rhodobacterales bacterium]|nr:hypothetical protein [Rhodobacterales bacterium]MDX5389112.1 hypothetical protein [Rhodobacterales bacterium]MDX5488801.1 hypothetical protein [Rhodobacterales bacterium]
MNKKPECFLWVDTNYVQRTARAIGWYLHACLFELTMQTAETHGTIGFDAAVAMLARALQTDQARARRAILDLVERGQLSREGDMLRLTAFGTSIVPDYADWEPSLSA